MSTITSANLVFMLAVSGLYTVPQQIQGFATDDCFDFDDVDVAETMMGVDGNLSAGFIFNQKPQTITLQADSPSCLFFDAWYAAEKAKRDKYIANAIVSYPSINYSVVLTKGFLKSYSPLSSAKKVLQPRKFSIHWESIVGAPI